MERRNRGELGRERDYARGSAGDPFPLPVRRWQVDVHVPGVYDMEVDTSLLSPEVCADAIRRRLDDGPAPTAFQRLAGQFAE